MPDELPKPSREAPISDAERDVVVACIRRAMVDELIAFSEIDERFEAVHSADTRSELAKVTEDLPDLPPPSPSPSPSPLLLAHPTVPVRRSVFGELKSSGVIGLDQDVSYTSVFGSVTVDLSSLVELADAATVSARSIFGEVTVIVPDGYRVAIETMSVFGSSTEALSPPLPGAATIRVKVASVFGETKVFSLSRVPRGRLRQVWDRLRGTSTNQP